MTRLTLRKGLSLQPVPEGGGHLTDTRTGDALVVPPADFELLSAAGKELDPTQPELAAVLVKYRPFYVEAVEAPPGAFYELAIEDAPTVPQIPSIAPVTLERPAVAPAPDPEPVLSWAELVPDTQGQPPQLEGQLTEVEAQLPPLEGQLTELPELVPLLEPETKEHAAFQPAANPEFTQPAGIAAVPVEEPAPPPATLLPPLVEPVTPEELAEQVLEPQRTEQVSPAEVAAAISGAASLGAPSAAPEVAATPRASRRPLGLALGGVTLLALAVAATFALRPKGEPVLPEVPVVTPATVAVVDAGRPELIIDAGVVDAGAPENVVDAGVPAPVAVAEVDAGAKPPLVAEPIVDAGSPAVAAVAEVVAGADWLTADVVARGRVKMGEVTSPADGEVSWTVTEEARVKAKQALGNVVSEGGATKPLPSPSVGLAMLKQPSGAKVKSGAVLAEIIYFEAWARGSVKGAAPKMGWRCEVSSAALGQKADCKISVVAPKGNGATVTVAIEPRWFDGATDAVLRFAP